MKLKRKLVISILLPILSACTSQPTKPEYNTSTTPIDSEIMIEPIDRQDPFSQNELTIMKSGKILTLVRVMEGGACKNKQQGAIGLFGLYASKDDITRIKRTQGSDIFSDYEHQIQNFSMLAIQGAIQQLDYQIDTLTKQQLSTELTHLFSSLIEKDVTEFKNKKSLSIDVLPMEGSLEFYFDECKVPHGH